MPSQGHGHVVSPERQCWRTPPELWERICQAWHPCLDLAANEENHLCSAWFGPDHPDPERRDGLTGYVSPCYGTMYCNPGFSFMGAWCKRVRELTRGGVPCGVVMAPVSTSTKWWREWAMTADEIVLLTPRVQFLPPDGVKKGSNSGDNCLLIYRSGPPTDATAPRFSVWAWKEGY